MNLCRACGEDFASLSAFDDHRVGKHAYLFSEEHPDGRRCLTPDELRSRGMREDCRSRWRLPLRGAQPWTSDVRAQTPPKPIPSPSGPAEAARREKRYITRGSRTQPTDAKAAGRKGSRSKGGTPDGSARKAPRA